MPIIADPNRGLEPTPNRPDGWYLQDLTAMERAFVIEYPIDFNGTRAALRAGYGKGTNAQSAANRANELLSNPKIIAAILAQLEVMAARANLHQQRVLAEVAAIAFSNINNYVIDEEGNVALVPGAPVNALAAVSRIKKKIQKKKDENDNWMVLIETDIYLWNKNDALNAAMRHLGLFLDKRVTVTGTLEEMLQLLNAQRNSPEVDLTLRNAAEAERVEDG